MKEAIKTSQAPAAIGPYSQAIKANGFVFISGQVCIDPITNQVSEGDIKQQTERVLQNIASILDAAGTSMAKVVRTTSLPFSRTFSGRCWA